MKVTISGSILSVLSCFATILWLLVPLSFAQDSQSSSSSLSIKIYSLNRIREGSSFPMRAQAYGGSKSYLYSWDLDGDGTFETQGKVAKFRAIDNGAFPVSAKAVDQNTGAEIAISKTITSLNVVPRASLSLTPLVRRVFANQPITLNATGKDPSTADLATGLSFHWTFGDGTTLDSSGQTSQASHTFNKKGVYRVKVTATDKDGGHSVVAAKSISVQASSAPTATPVPAAPLSSKSAVPSSQIIALWEQHMQTFGRQHCEELRDSSRSFDEHLAGTYYDAQWVYYQIGDYTHDSYFYNCAEVASQIYRDQYVTPAAGNVPGYWNFSHGLAQDWLRNGDGTSKTAAIQLATQAAYAKDDTPLDWTVDSTLNREVAYAIMAYLNAEDLGQPRRARLSPLVDQALSHINQWFVTGDVPWIRPFMVGLTAHALMTYYDRVQDPRIIPALTLAADKMWDTMWLPDSEAFRYTDRLVNAGDLDPAPDLNPLIAPMYIWLYHQTGEHRFLDRADQIFAGGVKLAWLNNGKQFNQSYRLSFEFVRLRALPPLH